MSSRTLRVALLLGIVLLTGCVLGAGYLLNSPGLEGQAKAGAGEYVSDAIVVCFGKVDVDGITFLTTAQSGKVMEVAVKDNDKVKAGQILVRIDDTPAKFKLQQAELALKKAQNDLTEAQRLPKDKEFNVKRQKEAIIAEQAKVGAAKIQAARAERLSNLGGNIGSTDDVEVAKKTLEALESSVREKQLQLKQLEELSDPQATIQKAENAVALAESMIKEAKFGVEECTLKAPKAGTILKVYVRQGDITGAQARNGLQPGAVEFCPETPAIIRAEVPQEFANRVRMGQEVKIEDHTKVGNGPEWKGKVTFIAGSYSNRRLYPETFGLNDLRTLEFHVTVEPNANPDAPPLRINQQMRVTTLGK
jgi:multidrug resistance efflux pump